MIVSHALRDVVRRVSVLKDDGPWMYQVEAAAHKNRNEG